MIERDIFKKLSAELKKDKITVITGARQVGKTTAMKNLYKKTENSVFITFDDSSIKLLFEKNPELFIEQYVKPYKTLFIDEFQYAKDGVKTLKYIFDTEKTKLFVSGSSKPEIAIQSLQYLVGRVSLIEMFPLSFSEFVNYKSPEKNILLKKPRKINDLQQLNSEFEEFLMFGGYPDVVKEVNFEDKKKILKDLVNIYLLKEIKDVLGYKNSYTFEKLLKTIAINNGKLTKYSFLANDLDISWNNVQEKVSILNKTDVLYVVKPFFNNKNKEIMKTPKIYLHDIGFLNILLNNFSRFDERVDKGELLESFILHELIKKKYDVKFWNRQSSEVDFILEKDNDIIAIECKSNEKKIPKSLKYFLKEYNFLKAYIFNLVTDKHLEELNKSFQFTHYINIESINFFE
ncbi:MAG: ATP-binding protein [Nanobdellota archaeon]